MTQPITSEFELVYCNNDKRHQYRCLLCYTAYKLHPSIKTHFTFAHQFVDIILVILTFDYRITSQASVTIVKNLWFKFVWFFFHNIYLARSLNKMNGKRRRKRKKRRSQMKWKYTECACYQNRIECMPEANWNKISRISR